MHYLVYTWSFPSNSFRWIYKDLFPRRHGPEFHLPQSKTIVRLKLSDRKSGLSHMTVPEMSPGLVKIPELRDLDIVEDLLTDLLTYWQKWSPVWHAMYVFYTWFTYNYILSHRRSFVSKTGWPHEGPPHIHIRSGHSRQDIQLREDR